MVNKLVPFYLIAFLIFPTTVIADEADEVNFPDYAVIPVEAGVMVPFEGVLLSLDAAAKMTIDKKFEDAECDLRVEYELRLQKEDYELQLSFKTIEIEALTDKYESMMILKVAENDRLQDLVMKQKPADGPLLVALGFGIGTVTSLGIFALSTEIVQ